MSEAISRMIPLTEAQRDAAINAARLRVAGALELPAEPDANAFSAKSHAVYPPAVSNAITALSLIMLIAAFIPSAMRLHKVGFDAFALILVGELPSIYWAAFCVVLMADVGMTIFIIGAATVRGWNRLGMYCGALICAVIALSGNALAVGDHAFDSVFAFLETFAPPVLVLLVSNILKTQMLGAIKARHAARTQFESALESWKTETANAKAAHAKALENAADHPSFLRYRAFALRAALEAVNKRMTTVLAALTADDWRVLITQELSAEGWYSVPVTQTLETQTETQIAVAAPVPMRLSAAAAAPRVTLKSGLTAGRYTGELDNAITPNADGSFTAQCPKCASAFTAETERKAKNALVAHTKKHRIKSEAASVAGN